MLRDRREQQIAAGDSLRTASEELKEAKDALKVQEHLVVEQGTADMVCLEDRFGMMKCCKDPRSNYKQGLLLRGLIKELSNVTPDAVLADLQYLVVEEGTMSGECLRKARSLLRTARSID